MNVSVPSSIVKMEPASSISLDIHYGIKLFRHCCTILSLIFGIPALLVVIFCSQQVTTRYSALIGLIVVLGIVSDIIIQLIWDPLMLLPALCILRENPIIPMPGGPNVYYEIWALVISLNIPTFAACFLERHQAVQGPSSRWLFSMPIRNLLIGLLASGVALVSASLRFSEMAPKAEHKLLETLKDRWPTIAVTSAKCYDRSPFIIFAISCIAGLVFCAALATICTWHTFALLRVTSSLSEALKHANVVLMKRLIVQAFFPVWLLAFPLMFSLIAVIAGVGGPLPYSLCYMFISIHSPTHSMVLFVVTPLYRRKLVEIFRRFSNNTVRDGLPKKSRQTSSNRNDYELEITQP